MSSNSVISEPQGSSDAPSTSTWKGGARGARASSAVLGAWRALMLTETCFEWAARIHLAYLKDGQPGARRTFAKAASRLCNIYGAEVHLDESSAPLLPEAKEVRVSNHVGYLDIIALATVEAGRFFAKLEIADWNLVGRVAKEIGTVFVERGTKSGRTAALKELVASVQENPAPIVVFPEGSTFAGAPQKFFPGAFIAACRAGVPVRPIALKWEPLNQGSWTGHDKLLDNVWNRLSGDRVRVTVIVLPLVETTGRSETEVAARCRSAIAIALGYTLDDDPTEQLSDP
jgi:1-acyl-sn-glycerol-3-phosphate acyltransferase